MQRRTNQTEQPPVQRTLLLRPPDKTPRQKVKDFFWDKTNKTCLTRSPVNWISISIYYALFLAVVMLIFYISMLVAEMVASRDSERPQYVLDDSPIGSTPSINFFPTKGSRNLIWLSEKRPYKEYVKMVRDVFRSYKAKNGSFNSSVFGSCSAPPFGYSDKAPCIFFRMNRILLWKPTPFAKGEKLPEGVPKQVKELIGGSDTPKIWITCNGTTAKDRDHIKPDFFQFQGGGGFDTSSYPFDKQKGFLDPIVALKFIDPAKTKKILYSFTCNLWAKKLDSSKAKVDVTYYYE